jgi:hypothetical protein
MAQPPASLEDIADTAKGVRLEMHLPYIIQDTEIREEIKRTTYPASTLGELFEQVLEALKPKLEPDAYLRMEKYLFDAGNRSHLGRYLHVSVNNKIIVPRDGSMALEPGDHVIVVGQMSGG